MASKAPVPDLKYLNLRALPRKAQPVAKRTRTQEDWVAHKKTDAAFRHYTQRIRRLQCRKLRKSLHARLF